MYKLDLRRYQLKDFLDIFFKEVDKLSMNEQKQLFNRVTIKKGTLLYRVREDNGNDLFCSKEWGLAPKEIVTQGRFNKEKEPVLYVATDNIHLGREKKLKDNQIYYESIYECKKDFEVGTLFSSMDEISIILHKLSMSIEEKNCLREEELDILETYEKNNYITDNVYSIIDLSLSPFFIHSFIDKDKLYDYTNKIGKVAINENGLRYASVYSAFERQIGNLVLTLDGNDKGNIALTEHGMKNIELIQITKKVYNNNVDLCNYLRICK